MPVSPCDTPGATVSTTFVVSPTLNAAWVTVVLSAVPATVKRDASGAVGPRSALSKVSVSVVPSTAAPVSVGAVSSSPVMFLSS